MVADALVYHPTVAHYLKFVSTTVGRDKVLRTIQYFARFYAWYLYRKGYSSQAIARWAAVKSQLGLGRKLFRVGKNVEHFKAASVAADNKSLDAVLRYCAVGRQLGYAGYLTLDALNYPDAAGIYKSPSLAKLSQTAYKSWLAGISFSLVSSLYSLYHLRARSASILTAHASSTGSVVPSDPEKALEVKRIEKETAELKVQLVSDLCDWAIPASALGIVTLDDGLVGLAGLTSSLIGVWGVWKKTA